MERLLDRTDAGKRLASVLMGYANEPDVLVLALPRGGVPVGFEIARALDAPLEALPVRKLGVPGHEELAMGAIATGGVSGDLVILNEDIIDRLGITSEMIEEVTDKEEQELQRRGKLYRQGQPLGDIAGYTVILVDDGIATGATMRAAIAALRELDVGHIIVAIPVAAASTCKEMEDEADEVVCLLKPALFYGVGQWYDDFPQTSDTEVLNLLEHASPLIPA